MRRKGKKNNNDSPETKTGPLQEIVENDVKTEQTAAEAPPKVEKTLRESVEEVFARRFSTFVGTSHAERSQKKKKQPRKSTKKNKKT